MSVEATVSPPARPSERPHHPVRALLLAGGPRFVRDAFGPMLAFYLGWRVLGFDAGIAAATVLAIVGYAWERGQGRSGLSAAIGLGFGAVSAALLSWSIWYGARSLGRDAPGPGHCGALPPEDGTRSATDDAVATSKPRG